MIATIPELLFTSSILIAAILLLRALLGGRIGARAQYALWLAVALRLLLPFSLPASSSVMNIPRAAGGRSVHHRTGHLPHARYRRGAGAGGSIHRTGNQTGIRRSFPAFPPLGGRYAGHRRMVPVCQSPLLAAAARQPCPARGTYHPNARCRSIGWRDSPPPVSSVSSTRPST